MLACRTYSRHGCPGHVQHSPWRHYPGRRPMVVHYGSPDSATTAPAQWPPSDWSPQSHNLHVYWDLDNKKPETAEEYPSVVSALRSCMRQGGCLESNAIRAFANVRTCQAYEAEEVAAVVLQEVNNELRCGVCGRRCKSVPDLQKHFKQLHGREHKKKLSGGGNGGKARKRVEKYLKSDKAEKYRVSAIDAGAGFRAQRRIGSSGQNLKMLLNKLGVALKDVPTKDQAADLALIRHAQLLLASQPATIQVRPKPPPQKAVVSSGGAGNGQQGSKGLKGQHSNKRLALEQQGGDVDARSDVRPLLELRQVLVVVSNDFGFVPLLKAARSAGWGTVIIASEEVVAKFFPYVDAWVSWTDLCPDLIWEEEEEGEEEEEEGEEEEEFYEMPAPPLRGRRELGPLFK